MGSLWLYIWLTLSLSLWLTLALSQALIGLQGPCSASYVVAKYTSSSSSFSSPMKDARTQTSCKMWVLARPILARYNLWLDSTLFAKGDGWVNEVGSLKPWRGGWSGFLHLNFFRKYYSNRVYCNTTVCILFFSFCSIGQKLVLITCKFYLRFCGLHIKLLFHFEVGKETVNDAQNKTLSPIKVLVNK